MKKTVLTSLMLMVLVSMVMTGCKTETPTDVVNSYFSSIKKSDTKEAKKLIKDTISEEVLNEETQVSSTNDDSSDKSYKAESESLDESLKMYLTKMDAKVLSENVKDDKATVKVQLKAPNYSNLLLEVMEESIADTFNGKEVKQSDVEKSLEEKIKNSESETRSGQINLTKKDNEWTIVSDADITNLLLGEADETESVMYTK